MPTFTVVENQAVAKQKVRPAEQAPLPMVGVPADQRPLDMIRMRQQIHGPVEHGQPHDIAVPFPRPHAGTQRVARQLR
jgi:hypothetical protein